MGVAVKGVWVDEFYGGQPEHGFLVFPSYFG
jgi:hypothetical protein